jgi:hypothetical protein
MSGALPCTASNTAQSSPMLAPGTTPSPPTSPAHRSDMMSPYRFSSSSTSKRVGSRTSCIAQLSMMISSYSIVGWSRAILRAHSRNRPSVIFMMLALCTAVTLRRPWRSASAKA